MSRTSQIVLVIAVFIGTGFVTRALFSEWMSNLIQESSNASEDKKKWSGNTPTYDVPKFSKPLKVTTNFEPIKLQPAKKQPNLR